MKEPISVAIGTYRDLEAFKKAIASVYEWTKTPFELILICNGTDHAFRKKFSQYTCKLQEEKTNIKYVIINNGNPGNSIHRNIPIKLANEYIAFLDDDAVILGYGPDDRDWLQTMYDALQLNNRLAGVGAMEYTKSYPRANSVYTNRPRPNIRFINLVEFMSLWRREAWEDIGYKDPYFKYPADEQDSNYRFQLAGWEVRAIHGLNLYHPITDISKTNIKAIQADAERFEKKWDVKFQVDPKTNLPTM